MGMTRGLMVILFLSGGGVGCVSEEVNDEVLGQAVKEATADHVTNNGMEKVELNPSFAVTQGGQDWGQRAWANSYNWFNCGGYSWGTRCNSSMNTPFIVPGWGYTYYYGSPITPWPYGWTTLGQHPFWCYGPQTTWQGWSYTNHCP